MNNSAAGGKYPASARCVSRATFWRKGTGLYHQDKPSKVKKDPLRAFRYQGRKRPGICRSKAIGIWKTGGAA